LFLIYISGFYKAIPNTYIKLFTDDTNVFEHGKTLHSVVQDTSLVLELLYNWIEANKLTINLDKT